MAHRSPRNVELISTTPKAAMISPKSNIRSAAITWLYSDNLQLAVRERKPEPPVVHHRKARPANPR